MATVPLPKLGVLPTVLLILALAGAGAGGYYYYQNQKLYEDPQKVVAEQQRRLIEKVGQLIELPQGEEPTVATIKDKEKLKDQPFFARAENEDKVLIYTQAKRVILYRPATNKVIEVAPLNIGTASAETTGGETQGLATEVAQVVKVALLNGTKTPGLTNKIEPKVIAALGNAQVVDKSNAKKNDYETTIVVDLSGKNSDAASELAQALGVKVGELPQGEDKPDADLLVLLGKDFE